MELVQYDKPVDRVRAYIRDYAKQLYGIENAQALSPLVEIAFDPSGNRRDSDRIRAATELARYSEVPTRSIEYAGGNSGPDIEVVVLGASEIKEPVIEGQYTERLEAETAPAAPVELPDEGREEGS